MGTNVLPTQNIFNVSAMQHGCCAKPLLELHITQRQLESPGRQFDNMEKALCLLHYHTYASVPIFSKDDRIFFVLTNDY